MKLWNEKNPIGEAWADLVRRVLRWHARTKRARKRASSAERFELKGRRS